MLCLQHNWWALIEHLSSILQWVLLFLRPQHPLISLRFPFSETIWLAQICKLFCSFQGIGFYIFIQEQNCKRNVTRHSCACVELWMHLEGLPRTSSATEVIWDNIKHNLYSVVSEINKVWTMNQVPKKIWYLGPYYYLVEPWKRLSQSMESCGPGARRFWARSPVVLNPLGPSWMEIFFVAKARWCKVILNPCVQVTASLCLGSKYFILFRFMKKWLDDTRREIHFTLKSKISKVVKIV